MTGGFSPASPTLQAAFRAALLNQGELALLIFVALAIAWVACRELLPARARARLYARRAAGQRAEAEAAGRRLLRIGFGVLWIADAILQAQPQMPGGLPSRVIAPAAADSPAWLQHVVSWGAAGWAFHPVSDATAAVWIQLGIGAWLLASARGPWSRLAGLAGAGWALVVWIFGEALGGLLAPGLTVLFGAPGAALVYAVAGLLIAVPERWWHRARLGRLTLRLTGVVLLALAVLQAWPGRGFWQGRAPGGRLGPLAAMTKAMAAAPQPPALARLVSGFGSVVAGHGFAVNLTVVVLLAMCGTGLAWGRRPIIFPAVAMTIAFFLADWVLVEDFGFFGGLGTDPNSMIPLTLLVAGAYLATTRVPSSAEAVPQARQVATVPQARQAATVPEARGIGTRLSTAFGTASASVVVALWACGVLLLGAAPMAAAAASH
jgi:hypothetical protein